MSKGNAGSNKGGRQVSFWSHNIRLIDRAHKKAEARARSAGLKLKRSTWLDGVATIAAKEELEKK